MMGSPRIVGWALAAKGGRTPDKMRICQALREPDWLLLENAIKKEVSSLWNNGTWYLTNLPDDKMVTETDML